MIYSHKEYLSLPGKSGVYVFLDAKGDVLYVGKAINVKSRVSSYFTNSTVLLGKTKQLVGQVEKIRITLVESELEALLLEAFYIKKYKPKYNVLMKDSKAYILIRITIKDAYPKVLLARRSDDSRSIYFGPYPNAQAVRLVLKTIRRIFPFQSVLNHPKRICLYHHLGLCPCPPIYDSPELRKDYRKNIRGIIRMLEGQSKKIMKELEKERDVLSKAEKYEEALAVQKQINALSIVTTPFHQPVEYDVNPNLRIDIRQQELDELKDILNNNGLRLTQLDRIECYDISNIQGAHATGSLVVLTHGEIDKSQYRKFKIRREWGAGQKPSPPASLSVPKARQGRIDSIKPIQNLQKPNDFAMMKEVLKRRFTHNEWDSPSLVIVDGGKGQVSAALDALAQHGITVPLIGLAKREETIVVPNNVLRHSGEDEGRLQNPDSGRASLARMTTSKEDTNFIEISLPKNSKALHLIMRIRDEAHRFAITYHRKLRSKQVGYK